MSINFSNFQLRMVQILAVLPSLGQLVQVAEVLLPNAAGLTKADLVISTVIAAEPGLVGTEKMIGDAITGVVTAYRASGGIPVHDATVAATSPAVAPAAAPATAPAAATATVS